MRALAFAALAAILLAACGGQAAPPSGPGSAASAGAVSAKPASSAPASSAAGGSAAAKASGLDKLTVVYGTTSSSYLGFYYGQDAGIFAKHGLDVNGVVVSNAGGALAAVLSGQGEIFQGNGTDVLSAVTNGANLVVLGMVAPVYPYKLMARPDIKTPADLKGKKIAIQAIGDVTYVATRVALQKVGIDPDKDVEFAQVPGAAANRAAALVGGAAQAGIASPPDDLVLQQQGFNSLLDLASLGLPSANQSITVRRDWLASHKELMQRYVDGMVDAIRGAKQDRAKSIEILKNRLKQDDQQKLEYTYDFITKEDLASQPFPKVEQFKDPIDTLAKDNPKVRELDISSILDPSFVQSAVDRGLDK
jgi:ABC-type nitrate/sulfonate/bicarbonate transport system substrate-binding protein